MRLRARTAEGTEKPANETGTLEAVIPAESKVIPVARVAAVDITKAAVGIKKKCFFFFKWSPHTPPSPIK